jgi:hypothetical protein
MKYITSANTRIALTLFITHFLILGSALAEPVAQAFQTFTLQAGQSASVDGERVRDEVTSLRFEYQDSGSQGIWQFFGESEIPKAGGLVPLGGSVDLAQFNTPSGPRQFRVTCTVKIGTNSFPAPKSDQVHENNNKTIILVFCTGKNEPPNTGVHIHIN